MLDEFITEWSGWFHPLHLHGGYLVWWLDTLRDGQVVDDAGDDDAGSIRSIKHTAVTEEPSRQRR